MGLVDLGAPLIQLPQDFINLTVNLSCPNMHKYAQAQNAASGSQARTCKTFTAGLSYSVLVRALCTTTPAEVGTPQELHYVRASMHTHSARARVRTHTHTHAVEGDHWGVWRVASSAWNTGIITECGVNFDACGVDFESMQQPCRNASFDPHRPAGASNRGAEAAQLLNCRDKDFEAGYTTKRPKDAARQGCKAL